jgi:hypothetical protein
VFAAAACSGGGGSNPTPTSPAQSLGGTVQNGSVRVTFTIPGGNSTSATTRSPQFVSRSILSAIGTVFQQAGCPGACAGPYNVQAAQTIIDLSPTSPNCTANPDGSRSCTVFLPAPTGSDLFELDTYDATAATITSAARIPQTPAPITHELSSATSGPITVTPGTSTSVNFALQGIIAGFSVPGSTAYQNNLSVARQVAANSRALMLAPCTSPTLPCKAYVASAIGGASSSVVVSTISGISANDGAGNPITGATPGCPAQDQFANPIALSITEPASAGSTQFQIGPCNGAFGGLVSTGTLSFPLDQLKVSYNGGGTTGNGTSTAPYVGAVNGRPPSFGPAPHTNITTNPGWIEFIVAPLFAYVVNPNGVANSSDTGAQTIAVLAGPGTGNATISAVQYLPPSTGFSGYTATPNAACAGTDSNGRPQVVVNVTDAGAINYGHSWTLSPGNLSSTATCKIALSDGTSTVNVNVCNTAAGSGGTNIIITQGAGPCTPPPPPSTPVQTVTMTDPGLTAGTPSTPVLPAVYKDAGNNTINGAFTNPVTLTDNDSSGGTQLTVNGGAPGAAVVVNNSSDVVRIVYSGLAELPFTITPSGTGVTGTTKTITPALNAIVLGGALQTDNIDNTKPSFGQQTVIFNQASGSQNVTASEAGWSNSPYNNTFTLTPINAGNSTCSSVASFGAGSLSGGVETWAVTATGPGFCKATVADGVGQSTFFWVSVTGNSFTIQSVTHK